MKKALLLIIYTLTAVVASAQITIDVDANDRGPQISPTHYGRLLQPVLRN